MTVIVAAGPLVALADLSVIALAQRFQTRRVLTFDARHFRALRPLDGRAAPD